MSDQIPEDVRNEIKFVAFAKDYYYLLHWLKLHPAGFYSIYPDRKVNNIYFDSHDYVAYTDNLSGSSSRRKVRYRWYGNSLTPGQGVLEIKHKRNFCVWKSLFKIPESPYKPKASWKSIQRHLYLQVPDAGKKWLDENPVPILINRYNRKYFLSQEGNVRVTVDSQLEFIDQRFKSAPKLVRKKNYPDIFVVEFKFNIDDRDLASQYIQTIPVRVSRNSKYISGLQFLSGN